VLTMEEETKSVVARMVDMCQSCSDDDFCKECREDIQFFQDKFDFDVTDYITLTVPEDLQADSEAEDDSNNPELKTTAYSWIQNAPKGVTGDALTREHPEEWCKDSNYNYESVDELAEKSDIHLWLADLKKAIDFDSHEEAEGARKLVEQAAFNLGTHGRQILQEELEEGDD